jgi:hypothetical protein
MNKRLIVDARDLGTDTCPEAYQNVLATNAIHLPEWVDKRHR